MNKESDRLRGIYEQNLKVPRGNGINCPSCGKNFIKKSVKHSFCSVPCKDRYRFLTVTSRRVKSYMHVAWFSENGSHYDPVEDLPPDK